MSALWADTTVAELLEWLPLLWQGFLINLQVTGLTIVLGVPLGFLLALLVRSHNRWVHAPAIAFVEVGRGAPALVLVQFIYFGLPQINLTLESFAAAVVAMTLSSACYISEILRAGLDAVPKGQHEAAHALNFSKADEMRFVILPQAMKVSSPSLLGFAILILQSTALCFSIALPEIVAQAYEIGSISFRYFPVLVLTAGFFVVVCIPASVAVGWLEKRNASKI